MQLMWGVGLRVIIAPGTLVYGLQRFSVHEAYCACANLFRRIIRCLCARAVDQRRKPLPLP